MASWNIPALINKISEDIPALKTLLTALFKWTDADTTDVPVGAKRLESVTNGRQIQEKTASGWASVGKLMHDADTLDGWHAAQSALANHVVVRDSNGKINGDVLGNANTATTASGLAQNFVTPIANGGTGATSAVNARANLGANNGSNINTGVVGTAYGGTGRTDGKVTDVHLTDYNTGAVGVGQLGHAATKNGVSADSLIVPGAYYCTGCTVALHYPSTADCFIRVEGSGEISNDVFLVQKLTEMATSIEYRRLSYDGGASWDAWVPFDTAVMQKLFGNNGYGSEIKDERLSTDITVKDWDASHDYPANVLAKAGGDIYRSVAASGPGTSAGARNPAGDDGTYWVSMPTQADVAQYVGSQGYALDSEVVHKDSFDSPEWIKGYKTFGNNLTVFDTTVAQSVAPSEDWFKYLAFNCWSDPSLRGQDINPLDYPDKWWRYGGIEYALRSNGIVDGKFYIYTNPTGSGQTSHWHYVSLEGNPADDYIRFRPVGNGVILLGSANNRWKQVFAASSSISTSDARLKTAPEPVPDAVLDAWGDVQFCQFKMLDAVAEKGADRARLHSGLIAQRIDEAFRARGLDASRYGLFCFDSWEAVPESRDKDGTVHEPAEPAGDMYSLRYEEALCMEAAYQRRRADRAEARMASLEERLGALEARFDNSN